MPLGWELHDIMLRDGKHPRFKVPLVTIFYALFKRRLLEMDGSRR